MTRPFPCCQCDYDCHCPDYEDDWTFVFCSITFSLGTWVSGTKIEDFLNGAAFSVSLDHIDVVTATYSRYFYLITLTLPSGGTHYTVAFQDYLFKTLDITIVVADVCGSPRTIGIEGVDVTGQGDINGTPGILTLNLLNVILTGTFTTCGSVLSHSIGTTGDYISDGTFKGTTGVVSLTC